jgi:hypothetical protein
MSNDVLITPASRKIELKDSSGNVDAKIETDSSGNLLITNAGGDISIGDTTSDVFIGDGTNSVDIVFEQNGEIRGTSGVTLTLGDANTTLRTGTDLSLNSNDLTNVGDATITGNAQFTHNLGDATVWIKSTRPTLGFTDTNSFTDANDIFIIRAGGNNLQFQWYDNSAGSTTTRFEVDSSGTIKASGNSVINSSGAWVGSSSGLKGEPGAKGQKGEVGAKGQKGEVGQKGASGAKGQKGEVGQKGAAGAKGDTGQKGAAGAKGQKGEAGASVKGQKGAAGAKGQKGEVGQKGAAGAKGEAGNANTDLGLAIGSNMSLDSTGNKVSKTTDNNSWNGEVRSTVSYTGGCYVTFSPNQNNKWFMMGLNTDPTTNTSYTTIDYQWYCVGDGDSRIYENGSSIGNSASYSAGDVFTITYDNDKIRYYRNGSLVRTVDVAAGLTLFLDSSFYSQANDMTKFFRFGPMGGVGEKGATGSKGAPGAKGATGSKGAPGAKGAQGNSVKGQKGEVGQKGAAGAKGQKGEVGQKGVAGAKGATGQKGATGGKGQKGEIGQKGAAGAKGQKGGDATNASSLSSGTVPTAVLPEFIEERYPYTSNDNNGVYMPMVKGGMYATNNSTVTGQILIKIPSYKTNMMQQFYIDIYEYATGESMTFRVSGYNYNDAAAQWINTSAINLADDTDRDFTVRFGADTTNNFQYVAIGETNSSWTYPQVNIRDFFGGYSTSESDALGSFDISFVGTTPGSVSRTHTNNFPARNVGDKGQKGAAGAKGQKGEVGQKGQKGEVGQKGQKGEVGQKGQKGEVGQKGQKGEVGQKGATGAKGQKGEIGLTDAPYGAVPSYSNSNTATITWNATEEAMELQSSDTQIGAAFPAFRVNLTGNETHKLSVKVKSNTTSSSGLYVRVYEYNASLPSGKVAVSNSASYSLVQEDTSGKTNWIENQSINTSWSTKEYTYTPTSGAAWASIVILNWSGMGTSSLYIRDPMWQLIGSSGAKGQKGEIGAKGAPGAKGQKGEVGAKGAPGAKGQKGEVGQKGATGTFSNSSNIAITKSLPKIVLDSANSGDTWTAQGAQISLGESGDGGSAALHLTYRGDGYSYVGTGALTNGIPAYGYLRFQYNATTIVSNAHWNLASGYDLKTNGTTRISNGGLVRAANGSVSAPSLSFSGDTNTGFFGYSADTIGVTTAGVRRARFGSTIFLESSDVRINEYLYHNGDTDTNIRLTGDRIRIAAGGLTFIDIVEGSTDYIRFNQRAVTIGSNTAPQATFTIDQGCTETPANGCGTGNDAHMKLENTNTTGSASTCIIFNAKDSGGNMRHGAGIQFKKAIAWSANGQYPGELYFWTRPTSGDQAAAQKLDKDGNAIFKGNVTAYGSLSDRRLKENIENIPDATKKVQELNGVTFNYKKDGKKATGLIAQELQEVLPEAVYTTENIETGEEHLAIHYGNVIGLLVESIKELKAEIEDLKNGNN